MKEKLSIYADSDLDGLVSVLFILVGLGFTKLDKEKVKIRFLNNNHKSDNYFYTNKENIKKDKNFKIICDLGYVEGIDLWFEHHRRPDIPKKVKGIYDPLSKSSASLVYSYFKSQIDTHPLSESFEKIRLVTDAFDSGNISLKQIVNRDRIDMLASICDLDSETKNNRILFKLLQELLSNHIDEVLRSEFFGELIEEVKKNEELHLKSIFKPENILHLDPEGIILIWIKGKKFKVNSFLPLFKYKKFQMTCFLFGVEEEIEVRVYANPVYKETFDEEAQEDYKDYDLSALPKNHGGGGHRGAGGFTTKKENGVQLVSKLIEIDRLSTWKEKQKAIEKIRLG